MCSQCAFHLHFPHRKVSVYWPFVFLLLRTIYSVNCCIVSQMTSVILLNLFAVLRASWILIAFLICSLHRPFRTLFTYIISFTMQKLLTSSTPITQFLFPVLRNPFQSVFVYACICRCFAYFEVSGVTLRSVIHFVFIVLQCERQRSMCANSVFPVKETFFLLYYIINLCQK